MKKLKPCPKCKSDDDLRIDSSGSMQIAEVVCGYCGFCFQSGCWEENIARYWNRLDRCPSHERQQSADTEADGFKIIPDLPHGFNHCAYNRQTGEWLYINHANTWQLFQGPSHESEQSAPDNEGDK